MLQVQGGVRSSIAAVKYFYTYEASCLRDVDIHTDVEKTVN